jgi:hypothetical protein
VRRDGREKLHYLNAVPIRRIHDRWIGKYATAITAAMSDLKDRLEAAPAGQPASQKPTRKAKP